MKNLPTFDEFINESLDLKKIKGTLHKDQFNEDDYPGVTKAILKVLKASNVDQIGYIDTEMQYEDKSLVNITNDLSTLGEGAEQSEFKKLPNSIGREFGFDNTKKILIYTTDGLTAWMWKK